MNFCGSMMGSAEGCHQPSKQSDHCQHCCHRSSLAGARPQAQASGHRSESVTKVRGEEDGVVMVLPHIMIMMCVYMAGMESSSSQSLTAVCGWWLL